MTFIGQIWRKSETKGALLQSIMGSLLRFEGGEDWRNKQRISRTLWKGARVVEKLGRTELVNPRASQFLSYKILETIVDKPHFPGPMLPSTFHLAILISTLEVSRAHPPSYYSKFICVISWWLIVTLDFYSCPRGTRLPASGRLDKIEWYMVIL